MKSLYLIVAFTMATAASSCNKSYICECRDAGANALEHFDIKATTKGDAESKCAEHNGDPNGGGLINCHLK